MSMLANKLMSSERHTRTIQEGYKVKLCETVNERLKCLLCGNLMRDPVQTERGEFACAYCYQGATRKKGMCPIDGEPIQLDKLFADKAKEKEIRVLNCYCTYQDDGCIWKGKVYEVEEHEKRCQFRPRHCHLCHQDVQSSMLNSHLEFCDKWQSEKMCIYNGCFYQVETIDGLKAHLQEDTISHAMTSMSQMTQQENELKSRLEIWQEKDAQMENTINELKEQISTLMKHSKDIQTKYESKTNKLEDRIDKLETINTTTKSDKRQDDDPITNTNETVTSLNKSFSELNLRQQLLENTSYGGRLLWRVDNVSTRMRNSVTGSITALHSAPVFTSKYGYKFCARLYLNGDGLGKRSHVSLFIVMMKSEYDNILEWPFNKLITFRLINQGNGEGDDVVESFLADSNSSSFVKPKRDMNVACGCPLFVKREHLLNGGFIKDDVIFIDVTVS